MTRSGRIPSKQSEQIGSRCAVGLHNSHTRGEGCLTHRPREVHSETTPNAKCGRVTAQTRSVSGAIGAERHVGGIAIR